MAISTSLRNKLVGFIIVASTILIFLPVLLSKDMIKKDAPDNNAVAITQNGALRDANGNLVPQGQPNVEQALNISGQNNALVLTGQAPQRGPQPELHASAGGAVQRACLSGRSAYHAGHRSSFLPLARRLAGPRIAWRQPGRQRCRRRDLPNMGGPDSCLV